MSHRPVDAAARERWQRLEAIVDAALDLDLPARESFVRDACGPDAALRDDVLRLIADGEARDGLFSTPIAPLAAALLAGSGADDLPAVHRIPERIGPYRVVRELGRGGMGAVYLGERDDGEFRQTVALKLVRRGLHDDARMLRRFREERQILASLQHPDIARLLDGGLTEDGLPFFAMEYVAGEPIDSYCDARQLSVEQRLALFARVCDAMAHAHAQGIVHRDIKPSNILVTADGQPRLLDFGIAKLTAAQGEGAGDLTRTGERLLTPEYASPEQIRGEPIRAATDVYALGVLLYELLTGQRPFGRSGSTPHEIERAVLEQEPTRPSTAVTRDVTQPPMRRTTDPTVRDVTDTVSAARRSTPARLKQRLRGDLDAIVLQALRKESIRRYPTAAELGLDVRRHLAGRPVTARGDSWAYRTRKLMRRHRVAVAATLAVTLLTTSGALAIVRSTRLEQIVPGATRRVAFDAALELDPALSPDGSRLVYTTDVDGLPRLYVMDLATGNAVPLTGSMPYAQRAPRWSPNGNTIAFQGQDRIFEAPAAGGPARVLVEPGPAASWVGYPAWSPDGREIAYVEDGTVLTRPARGGATREVSGGWSDPHSLAWSPDGRWIALVDGNLAFVMGVWQSDESLVNLGNAGPSSIWLVPADGGAAVRITDDAFLNTSPVWLPGGRALLFVSNRAGERDVFRVDLNASGRPARDPVRVTAGLGAHTISLSADGRRLTYTVFRNLANVWSAPLPGSAAAGEAPRAVTRGTQSIEGLHISPDGAWLAFDSDRNGRQHIYRVPIDGGEPVQVTTGVTDDFMPRWSPDGREIAYYAFQRDGTRQLHLVPAAGGTAQTIVTAPRDQRTGSWSPDARSMVFTSASRLFVVSRDDTHRWGAARPLTSAAGGGPRWSPDSRMIAFVGPGGIWITEPERGSARQLLQLEGAQQKLGNIEWRPDGRAIIYKWLDAGGRASFWSVPADGGTPHLVLRLDERFQVHRPEFATDGDRVFFTVSDRESDVWIMELTRERR